MYNTPNTKPTEDVPHKPLIVGCMPTFPKTLQIVAIVDAFWHIFGSLNAIKLKDRFQGF